jgi:hypothetical protein
MEQTAKDVRHAARGGGLQLLAALGQGLMPVTHVLMARLYGLPTFGAFQANAAILDVLTRTGPVGSVGGLHRFIAAHRATGDEELAQRALGTGIRLTTAVSTVVALGVALLAPILARACNEPSLATTLPIMAPTVLLSALTVVLVAATLGAKVQRMNLYVRGIAEPVLLLAVLLAWAWRQPPQSGSRMSSALVALLAVAACACSADPIRQALGASSIPASCVRCSEGIRPDERCCSGPIPSSSPRWGLDALAAPPPPSTSRGSSPTALPVRSHPRAGGVRSAAYAGSRARPLQPRAGNPVGRDRLRADRGDGDRPARGI